MKTLRALLQWLKDPKCFCCLSSKPICHQYEDGRRNKDGSKKDSCPYCDHSANCHPLRNEAA